MSAHPVWATSGAHSRSRGGCNVRHQTSTNPNAANTVTSLIALPRAKIIARSTRAIKMPAATMLNLVEGKSKYRAAAAQPVQRIAITQATIHPINLRASIGQDRRAVRAVARLTKVNLKLSWHTGLVGYHHKTISVYQSMLSATSASSTAATAPAAAAAASSSAVAESAATHAAAAPRAG